MECYPSFQEPLVCESAHDEPSISIPDTTVVFIPPEPPPTVSVEAVVITAVPYLPETGFSEGILFSAIFVTLIGLFMTTVRRK